MQTAEASKDQVPKRFKLWERLRLGSTFSSSSHLLQGDRGGLGHPLQSGIIVTRALIKCMCQATNGHVYMGVDRTANLGSHPLVKLLLVLLLKMVVAGCDRGRLERAVRIHDKSHVAHHGRQSGNGAVRAVWS